MIILFKIMITKDNYQAYFLDFLEGNLSNKDKQELEIFLGNHPQLREELEAYDESLVLLPDMDIRFEEKESLMHNKKIIFPIWIKYSSIAAIIILLICFSIKIFHSPYSEPALEANNPIAKHSDNTIINAEKEQDNPNELEIIKNTEKSKTYKNHSQTKKSQPNSEINEEFLETDKIIEKQEKVIISNSLIVYEVNNLIAYKEEKKIYEVDNLIAYKDIKNPFIRPIMENEYLSNLAYKVEGRIDKTQEDFNNAVAYIEDNVNNNLFGINLIKK